MTPPSRKTFSPAVGYLYVVLAAICWGVSGSAAKFLFHHGVTPFQLVQLRLTLAALVLFVFLGLRHPALLIIARADVPYFALFGAVGMAGVQFTYLFAISQIHVAAAILLQYTAPALIALHAVFFFRDRLRPFTLAALAGALVGCYLVVGAYNLDLLTMNWLGIGSGVLSAVTFAWYSIQSEYGMRRYSPWTVLFYALAFAALTWNIAYPPLTAFFPSRSPLVWAWILYIALLGTLVPFGLYLQGVNLIRATRASITATLEPITAGLLAYAFLGEEMASWQLLGAALVVVSIIVLQLDQQKDAKSPAVIRAGSDS